MAWFDGLLEAIGGGLIDFGEGFLKGGVQVWETCTVKVSEILTTDIQSYSAFSTVSTVYNVFLGIGSSLMVLYFVIGWCRESIDIRTTFTLENMFRLFIRLILTAGLLTSAFVLITQFLGLSAGLASQITGIGSTLVNASGTEGIFSSLKVGLSGGGWISAGLICFIGGAIGGLVIIVCGIKIIVSVMSRYFKLFLHIPFAPAALASFAGGGALSQMGAGWLKTFFTYCLEVVVISLALIIASGLFSGGTSFFTGGEGSVAVILGICEVCMPMTLTVACVEGAEATVRKAFGF